MQIDHDVRDRLLNRELSWVDFNQRVLSLAEDPAAPLLERAKFLAIFAGNLDEFYMVRVAGLKQQQAAGLSSRSSDGMTPAEQLAAIAAKVEPLVRRHAQLFADDIMPALAKEEVEILRYRELDESLRDEFDELFRQRIFPVLTPLAVDPAHPFPYISNLSLNLAVLVKDRGDGRTHFARVKVPALLSRFVASARAEGVFVPLEDVIAANLGKLFRGMEIVEHHAFRVTRNADLDIDDDGAEDLLEALEAELAKRRFSPAVRLEIESSMPPDLLERLMRELQVGDPDVHSVEGPLDLTGLWGLHSIDRPDLKDEPFHPATHPAFHTPEESTPRDIFSILKEQDVLVHHPYESFRASVQRFIEEAADDPNVLAIKQTLYRTSGESPIVDALIDAAESGKQVVVIIEIKARFDERANINWARTLERAGCHVMYGMVGLKTHCKLALVVRQEGDRLQRYVHVGTGNYNPKTARLYEDMGMLTADPDIGADVSEVFNLLTGYSRGPKYRRLMVAPLHVRRQILELIAREAETSTPETPGHIIMKLNALVDEKVIDALYDASMQGVKIDLIVRGICALRPGVPGLSPTIRVRSILGRFLEHSRVFYFRNGASPQIYIGSADMMHRNLDRRVEVLAGVGSEQIKAELRAFLELALSDNYSAWNLQQDGSWLRETPPEEGPVIDLQQELMKRARTNA